jgi:hypothetical protein
MAFKPTARDNVTPISKDGPTLASVAPEWVKLTNMLLNFHARRNELLAKIPPLQDGINKSGLAYFFEQNRKPNKEAVQPIKASPGAAELLGPEFTPAPRMPEASGIREPAAIAEIRKIGDELKEIDEAIELLHPQLAKARTEGSKRLWKLVIPEYRGIAGRICAALIDLGNAHLEQERFFERHVSAERASLRPIHGTGTLGDPCDPWSEIRRLLQWACECGHFDPENIPTAEWKPRPIEQKPTSGRRVDLSVVPLSEAIMRRQAERR